MAPTEHKLLEDIRGLLATHVSEFRVFKTKLLGDDEVELPTGRIPILEATQERLNKRVWRLEALVLMGAGGIGVFKLIGWLTEFWYHAMEAFKR